MQEKDRIQNNVTDGLNMGKIQYLMIGTCPNCKRKFIRPAECDAAACDCTSAVLVPLRPVLLLPPKMFNKIEKIANSAGVSLEKLVGAVMEEALKNKDILKEVLALE